MQGEKAVWDFSCAHWSRGCGVAPVNRDHHPRGPFVPLQHCPLAGRQQAATTGHNAGFPVCRKQVCFLLSFWLYSQLNGNQHFFFFSTWSEARPLVFLPGKTLGLMRCTCWVPPQSAPGQTLVTCTVARPWHLVVTPWALGLFGQLVKSLLFCPDKIPIKKGSSRCLIAWQHIRCSIKWVFCKICC